MSEPIEVTRTQFGMVPDWVDEGVTDGTAMRVYVRLSRKYADQDRACYPSQHTLAAELGLSEAAVKRAVRHLRTAGALQATRRRQLDGRMGRNLYRLPMDQGSNMTCGPGVKYDPSTNQTQELLTKPTSSTSSGGAHAMAHADARAREVQGHHLVHMKQRQLTQTLTSVWIAVCREHGGEPPEQEPEGWGVEDTHVYTRGKHAIGSQIKQWVQTHSQPAVEELDAFLQDIREHAEHYARTTTRRTA